MCRDGYFAFKAASSICTNKFTQRRANCENSEHSLFSEYAITEAIHKMNLSTSIVDQTNLRLHHNEKFHTKSDVCMGHSKFGLL